MFEWLEIEGFRGIRKLRMEGLARVNILLGKNGCGKTTVLEALALLCSGANTELPRVLSTNRGLAAGGDEDALPLLFNAGDQDGNLESGPSFGMAAGPLNGASLIRCSYRGSLGTRATSGSVLLAPSGRGDIVRLVGTCEIPDRQEQWTNQGGAAGPRPVTAALVTAHRGAALEQFFDATAKADHKDALVAFLRRADSRVQDAQLLMLAQQPVLFVTLTEAGTMPLAVMGDGINRMATMLMGCVATAGGCLLVDEIDLGLHHSVVLPLLSTLREESARWGTQVFATTHNEELLVYAAEAFEDEPDALMVYRLVAGDQEHRVVDIEHEGLVVANEANWEIR